jgi:hypothetical protein
VLPSSVPEHAGRQAQVALAVGCQGGGKGGDVIVEVFGAVAVGEGGGGCVDLVVEAAGLGGHGLYFGRAG